MRAVRICVISALLTYLPLLVPFVHADLDDEDEDANDDDAVPSAEDKKNSPGFFDRLKARRAAKKDAQYAHLTGEHAEHSSDQSMMMRAEILEACKVFNDNQDFQRNVAGVDMLKKRLKISKGPEYKKYKSTREGGLRRKLKKTNPDTAAAEARMRGSHLCAFPQLGAINKVQRKKRIQEMTKHQQMDPDEAGLARMDTASLHRLQARVLYEIDTLMGATGAPKRH